MSHKISSFDPSACRTVAARIEAALAPLAKELGIQISTKGGTYSPEAYVLKVECATITKDGEVQTKEALDFKAYAFRYGLDADDLHTTFTRNGSTWTLIGCKPRSRKYPLLCRDESNGKTYKLPADTVRLHVEAAKAKVKVKA
jgi:hypothetical protein